jgi:hypothetical protein
MGSSGFRAAADCRIWAREELFHAASDKANEIAKEKATTPQEREALFHALDHLKSAFNIRHSIRSLPPARNTSNGKVSRL